MNIQRINRNQRERLSFNAKLSLTDVNNFVSQEERGLLNDSAERIGTYADEIAVELIASSGKNFIMNIVATIRGASNNILDSSIKSGYKNAYEALKKHLKSMARKHPSTKHQRLSDRELAKLYDQGGVLSHLAEGQGSVPESGGILSHLAEGSEKEAEDVGPLSHLAGDDW